SAPACWARLLTRFGRSSGYMLYGGDFWTEKKALYWPEWLRLAAFFVTLNCLCSNLPNKQRPLRIGRGIRCGRHESTDHRYSPRKRRWPRYLHHEPAQGLARHVRPDAGRTRNQPFVSLFTQYQGRHRPIRSLYKPCPISGKRSI